MRDNEERRPPVGETEEAANEQAGRPDASVAQWAQVYDCAQLWVAWNARRRWPDFTVNNEVWAMSVTGWELHGRRTAA